MAATAHAQYLEHEILYFNLPDKIKYHLASYVSMVLLPKVDEYKVLTLINYLYDKMDLKKA
jgi:hypothetical protein